MFKPNWISRPGDTILDLMSEKGISKDYLSQNLDVNIVDCEKLIKSIKPIDETIADKLSKLLGFSKEFWLERDALYHERKSELEKVWVNKFPVNIMKKRGIDIKNKDILNSLLHFFQVDDIYEWNSIYGYNFKRLAFRKSSKIMTDVYSVSAWVKEAQNQVEKLEVEKWCPDKLENYIDHFRKLTKEKKIENLLPKLVKLCAECGIKLAVIKAYGNNAASGATMFINQQPLIIMSFRYITDDHFWFTFFHEIGHLILHGKSKLEKNHWYNEECQEEEIEANIFSEEVLLGNNKQLLFTTSKTPRDIIELSNIMGISPGIIIGQMQYNGLIGFNSYNKYKRRYEWDNIDKALNFIYSN